MHACQSRWLSPQARGAARRLTRPALVGAALLAMLLVPALVAAQTPVDRATASMGARTAVSGGSGASGAATRRPFADERRTARPSAHRAAAPAQDAAARAPVTLTVGGRSFEWRTLPESPVTVELRSGEIVKATAWTQSDARGRVETQLEPVGEDFVTIEAGDTVRFKADGLDDVWHVSVPVLAADVDAVTDAVVGRAPAGATVALAVRLRTNAALDFFGAQIAPPSGADRPEDAPSVERRATAGPDGAVRFDLAGDADVRPGDGISLALQDPDGDTFVAVAAATQVWLPQSAEWAIATATLGTTVTLTVLAPDGQTRVVLHGRTFDVLSGSQMPVAYLYPSGEDREDEEEAPVPIAGDALVLQRSAGLAPQRVTTATLPALAIDGLDRDGSVRGAGPPGAALSARLYGPLGEESDLAVAPGADGAFAAKAPTPLGPGWRALLVWSDPGGVATGVLGVVPHVRARVGSAYLSGVGWPGRPVTVTLRSGAAKLGSWSDTVSDNGMFRLALVRRRADGTPSDTFLRLAPGLSVEVEFDDGDPVVVGIADVTTSTDPDRETVTGTAPPGAALTLTIMRPVDEDAVGDVYEFRLDETLAVQTGLDGRWTVDFGADRGPDHPPIDIEPQLWGEVVLVRPDGHFIVRGWAPVRINVGLGVGFVAGFGPPGEDIALTLRDAAGDVVVQRRIGSETAPWGEDFPQWFTDITDPLGKEVPTQAGDTLEVAVGGSIASLEFPPIEAASHVGDDRITGRTSPDAPLDLSVWTPSGEEFQASGIADVDGTFAFDLAPQIDLVYNASVTLTAHVGRHRVWYDVIVPGLVLDLDAGSLYGSAEPDLAVTLTLERDGRTIVRRQITTDRYGTFEASLVGAAGDRNRPTAGDVVVLAAPGARFIEKRVAMAVPELTIELPSERDHLRGRFGVGGSLSVDMWSEGPTAESPDSTELVTGADGRWRLDWSNRDFRLLGGWSANATLSLPSGHEARRTRTVPRLDLRLGSPVACGDALPHAPVRVSASGPSGSGSGTATSTTVGRFRIDLAGSDREPRPIVTSDTVSADLGGWPATLTVPRLDLAIDWAHDVITGTTTPSATLMLAAWQGDCTAAGDGSLWWSNWSGTADAAGGFNAPVPDAYRWWGVDRRFAVVVLTPDGHRVFRPLAEVGITARPDTAEALGVAQPGAPLTATLHAPDGRLRAAADGTVTSDGTWTVAFAAEGTPVRLRDGDRLSVGAGGSVGSLVVETLAFDFDVARGLMGTARPKRDVEVVLGLDSRDSSQERSEWYNLTADDAGAFTIAAPPPRSRWKFTDVRSVQATIRLTDGHLLESRLVLAPPPPEAVYLPVAHRK